MKPEYGIYLQSDVHDDSLLPWKFGCFRVGVDRQKEEGERRCTSVMYHLTWSAESPRWVIPAAIYIYLHWQGNLYQILSGMRRRLMDYWQGNWWFSLVLKIVHLVNHVFSTFFFSNYRCFVTTIAFECLKCHSFNWSYLRVGFVVTCITTCGW